MPRPRGPDLILVPTAVELARLEELGGFPAEFGPCALCGFGPVSAAARTAQLLSELRPARVLLVGIAGSLSLDSLPLASATAFASVRLDGVGAGAGSGFVPPSRLGFPQWDGEPGGRIEETLDLAVGGRGELLTVCAAAATPEQAMERRERYLDATAEDMEGFGVALACRLSSVPCAIVRGISNAAGVRDHGAWRVRAALSAARSLAVDWLARPNWTER